MLSVLLGLLVACLAQNDTFYSTRNQIEEFIPLQNFYCIHFNETFILKLDQYFHAPGLTADISIASSQGNVTLDNFVIEDQFERLKTKALTDENDEIGISLVRQERDSHTYLYFVNAIFELKIMNLTGYLNENEPLEWISSNSTLMINLDPEYTECYDFQKFDYSIGLICKTLGSMVTQNYLGYCNITERNEPQCKMIDLPWHDELVRFKMLSNDTVAAFSPFKGSCEITISEITNPSQVYNLTVIFDPPCYIEDLELIVTFSDYLLLISDRIRGLAFYRVEYSESNYISLNFVSSLQFPTQIFEIEQSITSTHDYVLIKSFQHYHIFLVDIENIQSPTILREYSNIFQNDVTSSITNGNGLNFNQNWIVSEVNTYHEERGFWNIFDQNGPDKNMPAFILTQNFQWIAPIYWYDDYLIIKRRQAFDLYRLSNLELRIKSLNPEEVGSQVTINIELSSQYARNKTAQVDLLFLDKNSKQAVFRTDSDHFTLLAGSNSSYVTSEYVSAPNLSLDWNLNNTNITQIEFQSYFSSFKVEQVPLPYRQSCWKQYYVNLVYEVQNPQEGQNIHYFCIRNGQHQLSYQSFIQAENAMYTQQIYSAFVKFVSVRLTVVNILAVLQNTVGQASIPFLNSVSFYKIEDNIIFAYNQNVTELMLHQDRFMYTNYKDMVVLLSEDEQTLMFSLVIQQPCCSFDLDHSRRYKTNTNIVDIIFIDLYTVYLVQDCVIDVVQIMEYKNMIFIALRNTIKLCLVKMVYFKHLNKFFVFQQNESLQIYRTKYSDSLLYRVTELPVFYDDLTLIRRNNSIPVYETYDNRIFLFFKDKADNLIVSLYDLTQNIHESLLFSTYLKFQDGSKLSAYYLEVAPSIITHTLNYNYTVILLVTTDLIKISLTTYQQSLLKVHSITKESRLDFDFTTGLDPITRTPTPIYNGDGWPDKVHLKFSMKGSGYLVGVGKYKTIEFRIDGADVSNEVIKVGLDHLFHGYYLSYSMSQKSSRQYGQAVGIEIPQTINQYQLNNVMISSVTKQVFQYKNFIMIVDAQGLITGFPVSQEVGSDSQSFEFAHLNDYQLQNVTYVISFNDAFSGPVQYYFWAVQATIIGIEQRALVIFQITQNSPGSLYRVKLNPVFMYNISLPVYEMKYSGRWNTLCFTTSPFNGINNLMFLFSLSWDPENYKPRATFVEMFSAFTFSISPFSIQSFSFNEQIPLILLGLSQRGVLGIHVYSHQIVFAIDIAQFKKVHPFELIDKPLEVAGINFLSENETAVFINHVGIVNFHFRYKFKLPTNPTVIVSISDSEAPYISGPNLFTQSSPDADQLDSQVTNLLEISYQNLYISPFAYDAQRVKLWAGWYLEVWLSYNQETLTWQINFFNFMQARFSKQFKTFEVGSGINCYYLYHDSYRSNYPYKVSFLVFCEDAYQSGLLWRYDVLLNTVLYIDRSQLHTSHNEDQFQVEVEAVSPLGEKHSAFVQIAYTSNTTGYESLYGLIGAGLVAGCIMLISYAGKYLAQRLQDKAEEQNFDAYYSLLSTITYRNKMKYRKEILMGQMNDTYEITEGSRILTEPDNVTRTPRLEVIPEE